MPFPYTTEGEVAVRDLTAEQALARLEQALRKVKAADLRREGSTLAFRGGPWRATSNTNVLAPVTRGTLAVIEDAAGVRVRYLYTFEQLRKLSLALSAVGGLVNGLLRIATNPVAGIAIGLLTFAFFFSGLVLGNWFIARERLPGFIFKALCDPTG
jgi:hypothetical protein